MWTKTLGTLAFAGALALGASQAMADGCDTSGMRSPGTNAGVNLTVVNTVPDRNALVWWIDFEGSRVMYADLGPNEAAELRTLNGHVWAIENNAGLCAAIVTIGSLNLTVTVQ